MTDAIHVAVAVLRGPDGRVLVAERAGWRHQGGGLEFPGGKVDPGETVGDALARELAEELGIGLQAWRPLIRVRHCYPDRSVVLHVGRVDSWTGEPRGAEQQKLAWAAPADLDPASFPAANRPIVAALRLPAYCVVTPPVPERERESVLARLEAVARGGAAMVQLRLPGWSRPAWDELLEAAAPIVDRGDRRVLLVANTADPAWLDRYPVLDGIHLSARAAAACTDRPVGAGAVLSCAAHDPAEIAQAERVGADVVVAGHVRDTPSHEGMRPLGWPGLEALTARTALPVYAIGGLGPADLEEARANGAVGVAGIRGFAEPGALR